MFRIVKFGSYFLIRCEKIACRNSISSNHGYVYSCPPTDFCQGCKEKIPEHIRIQAKILEPVKWGHL